MINLHCIFKAGFAKGLERYSDEENKLHHDLIINNKFYPGYDGYRIHKGLKNIKKSRKLQKMNKMECLVLHFPFIDKGQFIKFKHFR